MTNATTIDREIVVSRLLDAPRELVYRVWTEPEHVAKWWGPNGFTNTILQMEVRSGGEWKFIMHGPDGTDYENLIVFTDVSPPARLAYEHSDWNGGMRFSAEALFEEQGDKTLVTMRSVFETAEIRQKMVEQVGAIEGAKQTLERMAAYAEALR
jgi:uncharacterized protein YndB with AHSA1/START domain